MEVAIVNENTTARCGEKVKAMDVSVKAWMSRIMGEDELWM